MYFFECIIVIEQSSEMSLTLTGANNGTTYDDNIYNNNCTFIQCKAHVEFLEIV